MTVFSLSPHLSVLFLLSSYCHVHLFSSRQASQGILGGMLGRERAERAKRADEIGRHNRFGGQFRIALSHGKSIETVLNNT